MALRHVPLSVLWLKSHIFAKEWLKDWFLLMADTIHHEKAHYPEAQPPAYVHYLPAFELFLLETSIYEVLNVREWLLAGIRQGDSLRWRLNPETRPGVCLRRSAAETFETLQNRAFFIRTNGNGTYTTKT